MSHVSTLATASWSRRGHGRIEALDGCGETRMTRWLFAGLTVAAFVVWLVVGGPVALLVAFFAAAITIAGTVASPKDVWRAVWPGYRRNGKPGEDDAPR
jgi:hypothetical protein